MCVMGCTCQRGTSGIWVIQEAGLGYKNDEKEDSLPAWWQWGAPCEFGTSGSCSCSFSTHQTKPFPWIQKLWIRPVPCFIALGSLMKG